MYRDPKLWKRIRMRVLQQGESRRHVAKCEGMSLTTLRKILNSECPVRVARKSTPRPPINPGRPFCGRTPKLTSAARWSVWFESISRTNTAISGLPEELLNEVALQPHSRRAKSLTVLAKIQGFSGNAIARHLSISRNTVSHYLAAFEAGGAEALFARKPRLSKSDDNDVKNAIFSLLHEPPSLHGFNRTTWKLADLRAALQNKGHCVGVDVIRTVVRKSGFRWRSAKVVLTSTDPEYREKLARIQAILSDLQSDERFFSIDEFGPFAIKKQPGKTLATPDNPPSVPQWQKSKGWLILTAALELATNQVLHFYSRAKNTGEMIRMAELLIREYAACRRLYLSWDAASWHVSKELIAFVNAHNETAQNARLPQVELVPLPASAQFLNVIEAVFSGMARAVIHNSDYASADDAKRAIDCYFQERNQHYRERPRKAGRKIWGLERVACEFSASNNCKDPAYR